ncbi:uncharacterized protein LOC121995783 isoform X1 [Zingiber officinale]|uniref:uncharacterized protein LOC121995783 isoform X1 n=1 Tax=Zingiber officinale TaxID=94328 RepID=UPI001C4B9256|nr:uncharacterized protein LOC121995783 isoform X1 [Zingiber officinale]
MVPPRKGDDLGRSEGSDRSPDGDESASPSADLSSGTKRVSPGRDAFARRLRDVLSGESDDREAAVLPWLQALDLQLPGACRADERSKPLLKLNVSGGPAEERLLAQLTQHFETSEVGMLARYLCVPLVSVRVGKVMKQGNILCPIDKRILSEFTSDDLAHHFKKKCLLICRGQLNLNLLPSSNMRLSFIGDDGRIERLAVLSNDCDSPDVVIEEIYADASGRSFLLKLPGPQILYYWCSEKSKSHGLELLDKMKDLLRRKPSLTCLTGISESHLDSFATHLHAYILGCSSSVEVSPAASGLRETECQSSCSVSRLLRPRTMSAHAGKVHSLCQGSLCRRLNCFKDEMPRISSSIWTREKVKRHGDAHLSTSTRSSELIASVSTSSTAVVYLSKQENDNQSGTDGSSMLSSCLPDIPSLPSPFASLSPVSIHLPLSQIISSSSSFSPYYCWCPPCPSSLHPFHISTTPELMPLPPLSSLLPVASSTVASVPAKLPIDVAELQALSLPNLVSVPLIPSSISVSLSLPCSQLPIFTPFMSDPIVHIPVIDFCSSGQAYLVSAGLAISSVISPLLPGLATPLIPKTESLMEKNAREMLHMLMASAPTVSGPQLMNVLPSVLNNLDKKFSCANKVNNHSAITSSSQLFCDGFSDGDTVSTDLPCLNFHSGGAPLLSVSFRFDMADHFDNNDTDEPPYHDNEP